MKKKLLGFVLAFVFLAMLAAPLVSAKPVTEKNNDRFEYFKVEFDGMQEARALFAGRHV